MWWDGWGMRLLRVMAAPFASEGTLLTHLVHCRTASFEVRGISKGEL
jgi:hypothetical protein